MTTCAIIALTIGLAHGVMVSPLPAQVSATNVSTQDIQNAIEGLLQNPTPAAIEQVRRLRVSSEKTVVPFLVEKFFAVGPMGRTQLIPALIEAGGEPLLSVFAERVMIGNEPDRVISLHVLAQGQSPIALDTAFRWLADPSDWLQSAAIDFLSKSGNRDPRLVEAAIRSLSDPSVTLRLTALEALELLDARQAIQAVRLRLKDEDREIRLQAMSLLAAWGDFTPALQALKSPRVNEARGAYRILSRYGDASVLSALESQALAPGLARPDTLEKLSQLRNVIDRVPREVVAQALRLQGSRKMIFLQSGWMVYGASASQLAVLLRDLSSMMPTLDQGHRKILIFLPSVESLGTYNSNNGVIVMVDKTPATADSIGILDHEIGHDVSPFEMTKEDHAAVVAAFRHAPEEFADLMKLGPDSSDYDRQFPEEQMIAELVRYWRMEPELLFLMNEVDARKNYQLAIEAIAKTRVRVVNGRKMIRFYWPRVEQPAGVDVAPQWADVEVTDLSYNALATLYRRHLPWPRNQLVQLSPVQVMVRNLAHILFDARNDFFFAPHERLWYDPVRDTLRTEYQGYISGLSARFTPTGRLVREEVADALQAIFRYDALKPEIRQGWETFVKTTDPVQRTNLSPNILFAFTLSHVLYGDVDRSVYRSLAPFIQRILREGGLVEPFTPQAAIMRSSPNLLASHPLHSAV